eukprot:symbB.v1.2.040947.t1/scaffold7677.1/size9936/1
MQTAEHRTAFPNRFERLRRSRPCLRFRTCLSCRQDGSCWSVGCQCGGILELSMGGSSGTREDHLRDSVPLVRDNETGR